MKVKAPHYLLFSEAVDENAELTETAAVGNAGRHARAHGDAEDKTHATTGRWHFVMEAVDGTQRLEASDLESDMDRDRLELLAVVRGLEGLDEPAQVTLVTCSPYVSRGFRFGLDQWRDDNWQWERFGQMAPIKNHDLWQRVDQAMRFHRVNCRVWRFDAAHGGAEPPAASMAAQSAPAAAKATAKASAIASAARTTNEREHRPDARSSKSTPRPRFTAMLSRLVGRWISPLANAGSPVQMT